MEEHADGDNEARRRTLIGSLVGAVAGTVFVLINADTALPSSPAIVVRVAGVLLGIGLAVLALRGMRRLAGGPLPRGGGASTGFSRGFGLIVAAEAVGLFAGTRVRATVFDRPWLGVGWVAVVVGVHFLCLGWIWRAPPLRVLGAGQTVLGVAGLAVGWSLDSAAAAAGGVRPGLRRSALCLLGVRVFSAFGVRWSTR